MSNEYCPGRDVCAGHSCSEHKPRRPRTRTIQRRMRHAVNLAVEFGYDPYNSVDAFAKAFRRIIWC